MPLGILSDSEFENELKRTKSVPSNTPLSELLKQEILEQQSDSFQSNPELGRGKNSVEVPNSLRKLIGETSVIEGREAALKLAKDFGIKPSSVSAYSNGSTSTKSYNEQPNLNHLNNARERIAKKARGKMILAMNQITEEKLSYASVKDAAGIAKDMSAIIKNMEPDTPRISGNNGPTFVFYSPRFKEENEFEVIDVQSKE